MARKSRVTTQLPKNKGSALSNYSDTYSSWDNEDAVTCPQCFGTGLDRDEVWDCEYCYGEGVIVDIHAALDHGIEISVDSG